MYPNGVKTQNREGYAMMKRYNCGRCGRSFDRKNFRPVKTFVNTCHNKIDTTRIISASMRINRTSAVWIFKISNRIVTSVFDSIRNDHNYSKCSNTYRHRFLTYLTEWRRFFTFATTPSNQQNLLLTMVQVLYLLEVFILAHYYGPPSTETPTTETTIVWCHKNSWIYLTSTYYWWLLRPTITIRFDSKWKNTICTALNRTASFWPNSSSKYIQKLYPTTNEKRLQCQSFFPGILNMVYKSG